MAEKVLLGLIIDGIGVGTAIDGRDRDGGTFVGVVELMHGGESVDASHLVVHVAYELNAAVVNQRHDLSPSGEFVAKGCCDADDAVFYFD